VCPGNIPIPDLMMPLCDKAKREGVHSPASIPMASFATLATSPTIWRTAMRLAKTMDHLPLEAAPLKPLANWLGQRTLPPSRGGEFRKWLKERGAKS